VPNHLLYQYELSPLSPCDLDYVTAITFFKPTLSHSDRLNSAVNASSNAPESVYVFSAALLVKAWRYNQQINVTPYIRVAIDLRTKYNPIPDGDSPLGQRLKVSSNALYNRLSND